MWRSVLLLAGLTACGDASELPAMGSTGPSAETTSGSTVTSEPLPSSSGDIQGSSTTVAGEATTGGTTRGDDGSESGTSSSTSGAPRREVVIQLVGNSYTAGGVGPMLTALAAEAGVVVDARVIAPGGQTLQGHWMTTTTVEAISAADVHAVTLQGQSLEPWLGSASFLQHAELLGNTACDAGAEVYLFQTWARAAGHDVYDADPAVATPGDLQQILSEAYAVAADTSCAIVLPVGDAWQRVGTAHPEISLYAGDGSHATAAGTYLAACVFAESILGVNVEGSWAPDGIDEAAASALQAVAHCTVADACG